MFREERKYGSERGFTLIELLVVVSIIGILLAIVLPAVQSSRESGRKAVCFNHLRQIGVALAGGQASSGKYPAAYRREIFKAPEIKTACTGCLSIHYEILPFLDQLTVYNGINVVLQSPNPGEGLKLPPYNHTNSTSYNLRISMFLCPSDDARLSPGNSYRGTVGPLPNLVDGSPWPGGGGAFTGLVGHAPPDFTDGLSMTIGFSERTLGSGRTGDFDRRRDYWYSGVMHFNLFMSSNELMHVCSSLSDSSPEIWTLGGTWWSYGNYSDTLYNHVAPPNWLEMDCDGYLKNADWDATGGAISARSAHVGGVNVLLMDGAVRFVRDTVDLQVWRGLSTRAGHEPLRLDAF